jgi:hypothetical protein
MIQSWSVARTRSPLVRPFGTKPRHAVGDVRKLSTTFRVVSGAETSRPSGRATSRVWTEMSVSGAVGSLPGGVK